MLHKIKKGKRKKPRNTRLYNLNGREDRKQQLAVARYNRNRQWLRTYRQLKISI